MTYCDTHCHLDSAAYEADRHAVLERAQAAGLQFIIDPGVDLPSSQRAIDLSRAYRGFCYAMAGFHPNEDLQVNAETIAELRELSTQKEVVAIGEIGLDYFRQRKSPKQQWQLLEQQLALAAERMLPVCIHNREASADLLVILRNWWQALPADSALKAAPGVLHAWPDNFDSSLPFIEMGFRFGVGGPVSFKNAPERHDFVRQLPLEQLLLETDAPYLTPVPFRGRRNEPAYIPYIAEAISKIRGADAEEIGAISTLNARKLFRLEESSQPQPA